MQGIQPEEQQMCSGKVSIRGCNLESWESMGGQGQFQYCCPYGWDSNQCFPCYPVECAWLCVNMETETVQKSLEGGPQHVI